MPPMKTSDWSTMSKGRFAVHRITDEEASDKLGKVKKVQLGEGCFHTLLPTMVELSDTSDPNIKVNDTVKIDLASGKITGFIKFDAVSWFTLLVENS
ncbi:ANM_collapsed_G0031270.mRNA.1.CDS.1 [Saccharomyces cerevisiae]|nr:ANM_collapsed_G0031270.mRNA.1.CDS.1 [Saccharomyces cerevisiae]